MRYWSKGLARRSALNIDWSQGAREISVEDSQALLASIMPIQRVRGELPPEGAQVIVAGDTQPPIVWRYISILAAEDFESIVKLATGPAMVTFLAGHPSGRRLFFRLARFLMVFSAKYVWTWLRVRLLRSGDSQEPALPKSAPSAASVSRLSPSRGAPPDDAQPGIRRLQGHHQDRAPEPTPRAPTRHSADEAGVHAGSGRPLGERRAGLAGVRGYAGETGRACVPSADVGSAATPNDRPW